jgi:hypothetical protein
LPILCQHLLLRLFRCLESGIGRLAQLRLP